jgi:DNA-binding HxlR family transcriptional regulator
MSRSLCPRFHKAVELVGSRWTGAVLQVLLPGPARFAEIRASIPGISDRMLSERLQELEAEGIVLRSVQPSVPVRVEYALSPKGRELQRTLEAIAAWAEKWIAPVAPSPQRAGGAAPGPPARSSRSARSTARSTHATARRSFRS